MNKIGLVIRIVLFLFGVAKFASFALHAEAGARAICPDGIIDLRPIAGAR